MVFYKVVSHQGIVHQGSHCLDCVNAAQRKLGVISLQRAGVQVRRTVKGLLTVLAVTSLAFWMTARSERSMPQRS